MKLPHWLALFGLALLSGSAHAAIGPEGWRGLPAESYQALTDHRQLTTQAGHLRLPTHDGDIEFEVRNVYRHGNGDISYQAESPPGDGAARLTVGTAGAFGDFHHGGNHWLVTSDRQGTWLVKLPAAGLVYNQCGTDHRHLPDARTKTDRGKPRKPSTQAVPTGTVIDLLLIYNQAFADRYPAELLETRLNHLVAIANQTLANSGIDLGVRQVGNALFNYSNTNANDILLNDLRRTLGGDERPGLEGLEALRDDLGADLVIMLRPHAIEIRGSCGVAFFPDGDAAKGTHVVSDGMSSWSVCLDDVMTHEIGHNLGAGHQAGAGGGAFDPRGAAFVRANQFSTVMSSFGTGRPDRFRGLNAFSSPLIECGGETCGDAVSIDNAAVMRDVMLDVAAYRNSQSNVELPETLPRSDADNDGDGVLDWHDAFPFDASEQADTDGDGTGDAADAFPANPNEQRDTDGDGMGDAADPDDDDDGVTDVADAFPLDASETRDDDRDGIGNNTDAFPQSADEFADTDGDGTGNNADPDDDGDGVNEFDDQGEDILVISTGNSRILRFDAATGEPRGIEVPPSEGLLTFQSSLAWRQTDHTLHYLSDSSVRRRDLLTRAPRGIWVRPFNENGSVGPALNSGFPTALAAFFGGTHMVATRMRDAQLVLFQGQETAGEDITFNWQVSDGESPIDVVEFNGEALVLGQTSQTIYRVNNLGFTFVQQPGSPWMQDPRRMTVSDDGRLFVTDTGRDTVVAIDVENNAFLGDFADLKANGYRDPTGVAMTREGELLVASAKQSAILAFDGDSGAFLGERVLKRSWGLRTPHAMIVVPRLLDRVPDDPERIIRPNAGLWFNPATNGRGFDIEVFGKRLSAIWYTYDEQGLPTWYFSAGILDGFVYASDLLRFTLDAQGQSSFEVVGSLTLTFDSERRAEMTFTLGGDSGGESLQWQAFDSNEALNDYTGLWNRADGPGWGISMVTQGNTTIAIAFIYDPDGNPRWVLSEPVQGRSPHTFAMNAFFSDTLCPGCSGASEFDVEAAGTMDLALDEDPAWDSDIQFPAPLDGTWILESVPIIRISDIPATPR